MSGSTKMTPLIDVRGVFLLAPPWSASPSIIYNCRGIRAFSDFYTQNEDVYTLYYAPMGLSLTDFQADALLNPNIITLIADSLNPDDLQGNSGIIYVPDTYIVSYPNTSTQNYSQVIIAANMGALPDNIDLTAAKNQVANVISAVTGIAASQIEVDVYRAPSVGFVTQAAYNAFEAGRTAAITMAQTDYANLQAANQHIATLNAQIASLQSYLQSKGLWPPV